MAAKGDVKKMYNCIRLSKEDAFMQCFVWRDLDPRSEPETYQVTVNNIGVKPAGAIATLALQKSADIFSEVFPETSIQLKKKSYVDDLGLTGKNAEALIKRTLEADQILNHANMRVKKWVFSGDGVDSIVRVGESPNSLLSESREVECMLGIIWEPHEDVIKFVVRINLTPLKNKSRTGADLTRQELLENPLKSITRRQFYSQVQSLFDPIGLLSPVLLKAKTLLIRMWEGSCASLGWDNALPEDLIAQVVSFFVELYDLETLKFPRSLWPKEDVIGDPELIVFSDGSTIAFGTTAYIRWKLKSGNWWPILVMSKSKIAPKNRITIPRLELNGAVLAKRLKEFLVGQLDVEFAHIYHLVDSSSLRLPA